MTGLLGDYPSVDRGSIDGEYNIFEKKAGILLKAIQKSDLPRNVKIRTLYKIMRNATHFAEMLVEEGVNPYGYTD